MRRAAPPAPSLPNPPQAKAKAKPRAKAAVPRKLGAIDDPVRLYLLQMGGIPLLTRDTEVSSARQIEKWRRKFRDTMLGNDLILSGAVHLLEQVQAGKLRLDRTIEVSVTNTEEKKRTLKRLGPNLETLRRIEEEKKQLFRIAMSRSTPLAKRRLAWRQLVRKRSKAVRLVEEMNLRIQRLYPLLKKLRGIGDRLDWLKTQRDGLGKSAADGRTAEPLKREHRGLLLEVRESTSTLHRRLEQLEECLDTTNDEEEHCYGAIHDADLLVVNGEDP